MPHNMRHTIIIASHHKVTTFPLSQPRNCIYFSNKNNKANNENEARHSINLTPSLIIKEKKKQSRDKRQNSFSLKRAYN